MKYWSVYTIIILAVITRFLPHEVNFAPITAIAIFSAVYLSKKEAVVIPLAARFVSDIFLGFFSWPVMVAVYASHLVGVLFGLWIKKTQGGRWWRVIASSFATGVIFFLVTNFAFLYSYYPHTLNGIAQSYVNALPFFRGTLLGDLTYSVALFGAYSLAIGLKQKDDRKAALQV